MSVQKSAAQQVIAKLGRTVTLYKGEAEYTYKAYLNPVRDVAPGGSFGSATPFGLDKTEQALYIGPLHSGGEGLDVNDQLVADGVRYYVRKTGVMYLGDTPIYCRALLEKVKEGEAVE